MSAIFRRNKALMQRVYEELWNQRKPTLAAELFERPEGVERFVRNFLQAFPDLQHTVQTMLCEADHVVVRFSAQGTHRGVWQDLEPTGRTIHYTGMTWARLVDNRIREHHTEWDQAGLLEQIRS